jgi:acetyltransferase-like isoleucine patch superfamily enzyme
MLFIDSKVRKIKVVFRTIYYSRILKLKFKYLRVYGSISIILPKKFVSGINLRLNHGVYINAEGGVTLGRNVTLSSGAKIISSGIDQKYMSSNREGNNNYHFYKKVVLGNNIWLGAGAMILPGVELIGDNVIVAAGAIVTKSFSESNIVLVGIPAKILKK